MNEKFFIECGTSGDSLKTLRPLDAREPQYAALDEEDISTHAMLSMKSK